MTPPRGNEIKHKKSPFLTVVLVLHLPFQNRLFFQEDLMEKSTSEETHMPGVSGKSRSGKTWFNEDKYLKQREQVENDDTTELGYAQSTGQNLVGRTDLSNQGQQASGNIFEKEIFEALKRGPTVDVANVRVHADKGVITLEGSALNAKEVRAMHNIVENIPGVKQVINRLHVAEGTEF